MSSQSKFINMPDGNSSSRCAPCSVDSMICNISECTEREAVEKLDLDFEDAQKDEVNFEEHVAQLCGIPSSPSSIDIDAELLK